jgi:hypothetical protein
VTLTALEKALGFVYLRLRMSKTESVGAGTAGAFTASKVFGMSRIELHLFTITREPDSESEFDECLGKTEDFLNDAARLLIL